MILNIYVPLVLSQIQVMLHNWLRYSPHLENVAGEHTSLWRQQCPPTAEPLSSSQTMQWGTRWGIEHSRVFYNIIRSEKTRFWILQLAIAGNVAMLAIHQLQIIESSNETWYVICMLQIQISTGVGCRDCKRQHKHWRWLKYHSECSSPQQICVGYRCKERAAKS